MDRADIIQYIDLPPREAVYEILRTCLTELITKGIVGDVVRSNNRTLYGDILLTILFLGCTKSHTSRIIRANVVVLFRTR